MTITSRLFSGSQDLPAMIDLLAAVRSAERIADYPSSVDLHEALALTPVQANTRLWFRAAHLIGFAFVDPYHNLRFEFERQAAESRIPAQMVAWGEECVRRAARASLDIPTVGASCRDDDVDRIDLLERHGFVQQERRTLELARPLDQPFPVPHVPAGFGIRPVAGEQEAPALVALHRAAFGTENMTVDERLAMMRVPEYDVELDLLAVAADGRLAAYCMCAISLEENALSGRNEGYTDPVATHPDFQRRGLARALLLAGFQKLKQRGVETAVTHTSSANVPMQLAAAAVGFRVRSTKLWFAKPVSQDPCWRGLHNARSHDDHEIVRRVGPIVQICQDEDRRAISDPDTPGTLND